VSLTPTPSACRSQRPHRFRSGRAAGAGRAELCRCRPRNLGPDADLLEAAKQPRVAYPGKTPPWASTTRRSAASLRPHEEQRSRPSPDRDQVLVLGAPDRRQRGRHAQPDHDRPPQWTSSSNPRNGWALVLAQVMLPEFVAAGCEAPPLRPRPGPLRRRPAWWRRRLGGERGRPQNILVLCRRTGLTVMVDSGPLAGDRAAAPVGG
jgi:hypothetical protein